MRIIEHLEPRQLLAWSTYASLIGQDTLAFTRSSLTGAGQTVAVLDTGVDYNHPSLGSGFGKGKKVVAGWDFIQNDADPMDSDGHGTSVASFVAGKEFTYNGKMYRGIAPDAKIVALRIGTGRNSYDDGLIEKALQWTITNREKYNITVVNLSLGGGHYTTQIVDPQVSDEFATLRRAGVFVVASSGNDGTANMHYPGVDASVFSVGSVTATDEISDFTQRMSLLDLLAPGDDVVSAKRNSQGYSTGDGTSYATPIVAGAAVLVRQVAPTLTPSDIASVLRTSSTPNRDGDDEFLAPTARVYGRLDLVSAMTLAENRNAANLDALSTTRLTAIDTAYDKSGVLHLGYYEPTTRKLMYAARADSGKWTTPVVVDASNADLGQHLSIAIDQAGRPAIAYFDATNSDLKYAKLSKGTLWTASVIDSNKSVGQYPSLAFDAVGSPIISYYLKSSGRLRFAQFNSTSNVWSTGSIDGGSADVGSYASLSYFDDGADGLVAVAYADKTNGNLKYARYTPSGTTAPGTWAIALVDNLAGVANIELTLAGGAARIAYQDLLAADVKFAYKDTTWFPSIVASAGNVGRNIRSYFDLSNQFHIVYYNVTKDGTYDAQISTATHKVVSTDRVGSVGQTASLAIAPDGSVTLVGLNRAGKQLSATDIVDGA